MITWDDLDEIIFDGTREEIEALSCPDCGGIIEIGVNEDSLSIECLNCGHCSRACGLHYTPNVKHFFGEWYISRAFQKNMETVMSDKNDIEKAIWQEYYQLRESIDAEYDAIPRNGIDDGEKVKAERRAGQSLREQLRNNAIISKFLEMRSQIDKKYEKQKHVGIDSGEKVKEERTAQSWLCDQLRINGFLEWQ